LVAEALNHRLFRAGFPRVTSCLRRRKPLLTSTLHHPGHLAMDQKATLEALEAKIVEACTNHELVHSNDKNYRACVSIGTDYCTS